MVTLMTAPPEHSGQWSINCGLLPARPPLGLKCMSWPGPSGSFEGLDMITGQVLCGGITSWYTTRARAIAPGFISALPERPRASRRVEPRPSQNASSPASAGICHTFIYLYLSQVSMRALPVLVFVKHSYIYICHKSDTCFSSAGICHKF